MLYYLKDHCRLSEKHLFYIRFCVTLSHMDVEVRQKKLGRKQFEIRARHLINGAGKQTTLEGSEAAEILIIAQCILIGGRQSFSEQDKMGIIAISSLFDEISTGSASNLHEGVKNRRVAFDLVVTEILTSLKTENGGDRLSPDDATYRRGSVFSSFFSQLKGVFGGNSQVKEECGGNSEEDSSQHHDASPSSHYVDPNQDNVTVGKKFSSKSPLLSESAEFQPSNAFGDGLRKNYGTMYGREEGGSGI